MELTRIHHVAYVVEDLDAALQTFTGRLGLEVQVREVLADDGVEAAILGVGPSAVELICPTVADSGVARFLEARGPGLHHVAFEVGDIEVALRELEAAGAELIDTRPRIGLGGHLVAFIHPRSWLGVLTELVAERR